MNNKNSFLFISLICFFFGIVCAYVFKSKQKTESQQPVNDEMRIVDSANKEHLKFEKKSKADSLSLSKQIDSLKKEYFQAKDSLKKERVKSLKLSKEVDNAYAIMDTSAFFKYCNELSAQVKIQDNTIEDLEVVVNDLQKKNDSLNNLTSIRLFEWQKITAQLNAAAKQQANNVDSLNSVITKKNKKLDKKYNVSLGAFGGITQHGYGGGVGIGVGKTVFSF